MSVEHGTQHLSCYASYSAMYARAHMPSRSYCRSPFSMESNESRMSDGPDIIGGLGDSGTNARWPGVELKTVKPPGNYRPGG